MHLYSSRDPRYHGKGVQAAAAKMSGGYSGYRMQWQWAEHPEGAVVYLSDADPLPRNYHVMFER